ncbi:hypothetical protein H6G33_17240 [Calothrix sp. FACHB-1219]|nr:MULTISPECIES: hypothetical protein [unclassified Calothrix]MBD2203180.1 hypothetical protein [Calothrix sp. FACHB-168]MBD2218780.1 hypothetical protein [Calothrix sp. FACHB-1219]
MIESVRSLFFYSTWDSMRSRSLDKYLLMLGFVPQPNLRRFRFLIELVRSLF